MAKELQQASSASENISQKFSDETQKSALSIEKSLEKLARYGGFDLLETSIEGVQNINPDRKARRKIFLTEKGKEKERETLKKTLELWADVISKNDVLTDMVADCEDQRKSAEDLLSKNLARAVEITKELETNYRTIGLFYKNTEADKVKNITVVNATLDQLKDLDNTRFIDTIHAELSNNYDRLDLKDNYGILVIPGYLGSNKVVEILIDGETKQLEGDIVVINTGAKNNVLPIPGLTTSKNVYDSTQFQKLESTPKTLGIIGGGNIGIEFANLYARFGVDVTVIDFAPTVLGREDKDIAEMAKGYLEEAGVTFKLGTATKEIRNNGEKVVVDTEKYGELEFDALLHATGRRANTENLGLENTDIKVNERGFIEVDDYCQTNVENVFAVGDVNGGKCLAFQESLPFYPCHIFGDIDTGYSTIGECSCAYQLYLGIGIERYLL